MKKHKSGIGMKRWRRVVKHVREGRDISPMPGLSKSFCETDGCPMCLFCYSYSQVSHLFNNSDTIWWNNLSPKTCIKINLSLAEYFKLDCKVFII